MTDAPKEIWALEDKIYESRSWWHNNTFGGTRYIRADVVVTLAKAALEVPVVDNTAGRLALDKMLAAVRAVGIEPLDN
jgi:hypothetical protein